MNRNLYQAAGMALLSLPIGKGDSVNRRRRGVIELGSMSAANMISRTDLRPDAPMLLCGSHGKTFPILRQLVRMAKKPFVLLGTRRDFEDTCLAALPTDWQADGIGGTLPGGCGRVLLKPGGETNLMLKDALPDWDDHLVILCLGNGLQADEELLNLLNGLGEYIIITESLNRSVKHSGESGLEVQRLLASMDYIAVSSIGTAAKELQELLPTYEREKVTNSVDYSRHRNSPAEDYGFGHRRSGKGFRLGQTRTQETSAIFTQDDLRIMQDSNVTLIYNARAARTWVVGITR